MDSASLPGVSGNDGGPDIPFAVCTLLGTGGSQEAWFGPERGVLGPAWALVEFRVCCRVGGLVLVAGAARGDCETRGGIA